MDVDKLNYLCVFHCIDGVIIIPLVSQMEDQLIISLTQIQQRKAADVTYGLSSFTFQLEGNAVR